MADRYSVFQLLAPAVVLTVGRLVAGAVVGQMATHGHDLHAKP